ncbi:MAG TPA: GNAT family N-acetyltransferase [Blastocatellia bacterium]|nr:GNAT family N-acetyltransferase [Blastocatellia bacterium]
MAVTLKQVEAGEVGALLPLLLLAEPSERALRWSLGNLSDTVYGAEDAGQLVGAATMRWNSEPCEIVELAVAESRQGQGLGRQIIEALFAEARRRGKQRMVVGTGNSSLGNLAFYQKCGFRMDHVRRDYYWYLAEPEFENGIRLRDMLVFSYDLTADGTSKQSSR